jgi:hypothetical protein
MFYRRVSRIITKKHNVLTRQLALWCGVIGLPFVPVHPLARLVPAQALFEISTFPEFDFAPCE